ncbi:MAG: hypothetical protein QM802_17930 [Agriterribacter sp.]
MLSKTDIEQYFIAEKNAGLFFLLAGIAAVCIALAFFIFFKTNLHKGMAWPLLILGIIQAIVGYTIYSRSDQQRIDNVYAFDMNPGKLKSQELPRMQKAVKSISLFLWIELITLIVGISLLAVNRQFFSHNSAAPYNALWLGVGIVLIVEALLLSGPILWPTKEEKSIQISLSSI